jgi:hypothetical protein
MTSSHASVYALCVLRFQALNKLVLSADGTEAVRYGNVFLLGFFLCLPLLLVPFIPFVFCLGLATMQQRVKTNLEIEGAGTGAIHIADSSLFVPAVSATQRDLLQAVQLRLGHTGRGTPGAIPRQ